MNKASLNDAFRNAVHAIDEGNIAVLTEILSKNPELLNERFFNSEEGYFKDPYLFYFVAYNPVRDEKMPANILAVTGFLIERLKANNTINLQDQLDYTLGLVATGRIPKESG